MLLRRIALIAPLALTLSLVGCSASFDPTPNGAALQTPVGNLSGHINGGRQPISGAHIFLFAAGTTAYAGNGIAASSSNASISLLTSGTQDATPSSPTLGDYYVTTDSGGNFNVGPNYTCTPGAQVYLLSTGGDPGSGTPNPAASLMAILGQCPASGTLASQTPTVYVDEVSTVAAAYAFSGFATDPTHVSTNGSAQALIGIANAFATAAELYDISGVHGGSNAYPPTSRNNSYGVFYTGNVSNTLINSLANSLAACVNTTDQSQCTTLFSNALSAGSTGATPTDTATAAVNLAHNPTNGASVATIFNLAAGIGTPFQPALSAAPSDFVIAYRNYYSTAAFGDEQGAFGYSIDSTGRIITNESYISGLVAAYNLPSGIRYNYNLNEAYTPIQPASDANGTIYFAAAASSSSTTQTFQTDSLFQASLPVGGPYTSNPAVTLTDTSGQNALMVDGTGDIWIALPTSLFRYAPGYSSLIFGSRSGSTFTGVSTGFSSNKSLIADPSNYAWIAGPEGVNRFAPATGVATFSPAVTSGGILNPRALATDATGNIWVANATGTISELTNLGQAVRSTPFGTSVSTRAAASIALDSAGRIFTGFRDTAGPAVGMSLYSPSGALLDTVTIANTSYGEYSEANVQIEPSGNVLTWQDIPSTTSTNDYTGGYMFIEYIGLASPVETPYALAIHDNKAASRP